MPRRIAIASLVLAVAMLAGVAAMPVSLVRVRSGDDTLACARGHAGTAVTLTFTHSMYGGDVSERFRIGPGNTLIRTLILTDNAAAAEYYAWTGNVRRLGDRYEVVAPEEAFAALRFRIDHIGDHRLTIDGRTWNLATGVDGSLPGTLSAVSRPLVTQILGTRC